MEDEEPVTNLLRYPVKMLLTEEDETSGNIQEDFCGLGMARAGNIFERVKFEALHGDNTIPGHS